MKYIIDIPDKYVMTTNPKKLMILEKGITIATGIELTPYTEPYRQAIEDEVWSFAWKIFNMDFGEYAKLFDDNECPSDYRETKAKYESWKKQKDEIRVGDEVEYECGGDIVRFVVTGFRGERAFGFKNQCEYDDVGEYCDIEDLWKTGRHFDEVAELLKKMKDK